MDGFGRVSGVRNMIDGSVGGGTCGNAPRLMEMCRMGSLTNSARSGVVMIVLAVETFKQCVKVSSDGSVSLSQSWRWDERHLED